ncbi:copper resistance system multicopper oxidase [Cupriavidus pauculus]|uniref:copper resistance system multicopper oxidase n=1 Tax=Cupriavidus pauculus TaxID=82633 RepID=UPI001247A1A6|nr:copper resistance system multicopper oxidase [Cupriavidus pauculus]KAB0595520.1 copper resistance system multicopper oxidase [Cupriavidus pauculus]UAL03982.1 copper resistance system multicopper oxidase [Cupriavidus pauculus]
MTPPLSLSRRRLLRSLIAGGGLASLGAYPHAVWASKSQSQPVVLTGTTFDLDIGATPMSFTGRVRPTTSVNGSIPAPILRWKQGTEVTLRVTNLLTTQTSIHWHGILLPFQMDGVPGISFPGIGPGETFVYRFQVRQAGTYWYHAHTRFQEQTGLYGPLVIEPMHPDPIKVDRDYVVMLSEWTDENPEMVFAHLKKMSDFYNFQMPTIGDFVRDVSDMGLSQALAKRAMWNQMRMNPTDLADVSGATFTYLVNGMPADENWTAIAKAGERVRLRFINGSATSTFDIRIPGIKLKVVSADGQDVEPVQVDEFRIAVAETYDVVVEMPDDKAYTIFAQSMDRSGYARATLAPEIGMQAEVPRLDPKTWLTMADMGMGDMPGMEKGSMDMGQKTSMNMPPMEIGGGPTTQPMTTGATTTDMTNMAGHTLSTLPGQVKAPSAEMPGMDRGKSSAMPEMQKTGGETGHEMGKMGDMSGLGPQVDMRSMNPSRLLSDPGPRLRNNGRRVLTYADLKTLGPVADQRPPTRELELRLTGNMRRFIWGIDGKKFSQAEPIRFYYGERLRITLINDTMMNHPMHLHGMFSELENHEGQALVRKHTINVQPSKQVSFLVTADAPGQWAFHCHLLYHMEAGMFRKIVVA